MRFITQGQTMFFDLSFIQTEDFRRRLLAETHCHDLGDTVWI